MQKSHVLLSLAVAGLAACVVTVSLVLPVRADLPTVSPPSPPVVELPPPPAPEPAPVVDDNAANERHERLRSYVLDVMNSWTHAVKQVEVADYGDIASDIATAVMDEAKASELTGHGCGLLPSNDGERRCLWGPPWNSDHAKAVLLAALAYWEGARYAAYVDDGRCNDPVWRASAEGQHTMLGWGDCDHAHAHSIWQIHPIVDVASPLYALCKADRLDTHDTSRVGAATCALAIARGSMTADGTLAGYTGEFSFEHPKADIRLDFAQRAVVKHPWEPLATK